MDQNLFHKYTVTIKKAHTKKDEIVTFLEKETGALFLPEEIIIQNNKISFQTSSVKKALLNRKNIQTFLKEKKYKVSL
jgi:hypothetical protein